MGRGYAVKVLDRMYYVSFHNVHPRYDNIRWMQLLEEAHRIIHVTGSVFDPPAAAGTAPGPA